MFWWLEIKCDTAVCTNFYHNQTQQIHMNEKRILKINIKIWLTHIACNSTHISSWNINPTKNKYTSPYIFVWFCTKVKRIWYKFEKCHLSITKIDHEVSNDIMFNQIFIFNEVILISTSFCFDTFICCHSMTSILTVIGFRQTICLHVTYYNIYNLLYLQSLVKNVTFLIN